MARRSREETKRWEAMGHREGPEGMRRLEVLVRRGPGEQKVESGGEQRWGGWKLEEEE